MDTTISIRINKKTKEEADYILNELGLNMSIAVNMYLKEIIREKGIPFALKINVPNKETRKAIAEGDKLIMDKNVKRYKSIKEVKKDIDI